MAFFRLLEDGTSKRLLENGTDRRILEGADSPPIIPPLFGMPWRASVDTGESVSARAKAQEAPFAQDNWAMPGVLWKAVPPLVVANLLLTTLASAPAPVQARTFDLPRATFTRPDFAPRNLLTGILPPQALAAANRFDLPRVAFAPVASAFPNLLESTLATPAAAVLPFSKLDWSTPAVRVAQPDARGLPNLLESTLASTAAAVLPFAKTDWSMPPVAKFDAGEIVSARVETAAVTVPPFALAPQAMPAQSLARVEFRPPNLLESTLAPTGAAAPPFVPMLWALPAPRPQVRSAILFRPPPEDVAAPFAAEFFGLPERTFVRPEFRSANLLETTLAPTGPVVLPFALDDWTTPPVRITTPDAKWVPNLLETTLVSPPVVLPFALDDWSTPPVRVTTPDARWVPNLLEGTLAPPAVAPFSAEFFALPDVAVVRDRFNPPNLLESTLAQSLVLPFRKTEWSTPPVRITTPDAQWVRNLLESTLAAPPVVLPFRKLDWSRPPVRVTTPDAKWVPNLTAELGRPVAVYGWGARSKVGSVSGGDPYTRIGSSSASDANQKIGSETATARNGKIGSEDA